MSKALHLLALIALLLAGCAPAATATGEPAASAEPASTDEVAPTASLPTATVQAGLPTASQPAAALLERPVLVEGLGYEGRWFVFTGSTGEEGYSLWALNQDLTRLHRLSYADLTTPVIQPIPNPDGSLLLAYITGIEQSPRLHLLNLSTGEMSEVTPLADPQSDSTVGQDPLAFDLYLGLIWDGLKWSPDGRRLAFVSAFGTESIDVFSYDLDTKEITRLTSGGSHATDLLWSPDGSYVAHVSYEWFGMGGPGPDCAWAARVDGSGSVSLCEAVGGAYDPAGAGVRPVAWIDDHTIAVSWNDSPEGPGLWAIDVHTRERALIAVGDFYLIDYIREQGTWILLERGGQTHLLQSGQPDRILEGVGVGVTRLPGQPLLYWTEERSIFHLVTLDGEFSEFPIPAEPIRAAPIPSPDGSYWAWEMGRPELYVGAAFLSPDILIGIGDSEHSSPPATWIPGRQRLLYSLNGSLWYADAPDFVPVLLTNGLRIVPEYGRTRVESGNGIPPEWITLGRGESSP